MSNNEVNLDRESSDIMQYQQQSTGTAIVLRRESPQILFSSSSRFPRTLDKLKIRKRINLFPLRVTLKADYETSTRNFVYGCSVKDSLLKGRFSVNVPDKQVDYRKQFSLPNGSKLALVGSVAYRDGSIKPDLGVQLKFGADTVRGGHADAIWMGNSFGIRQKFDVVRGLGFEVCGGLSFPTPTARYTYDGGSLTVGEGAFQMHISEVNGIVRLGYK